MTATAENGWELSITRHIVASPAQVWDIMTNRIEAGGAQSRGGRCLKDSNGARAVRRTAQCMAPTAK